jgi:hypothetical protein
MRIALAIGLVTDFDSSLPVHGAPTTAAYMFNMASVAYSLHSSVKKARAKCKFGEID